MVNYQAGGVAEYYHKVRFHWDEFFESERIFMEKVFSDPKYKDAKIIDIGCGCGGLGNALVEKFSINNYTGLDINQIEIDWANENNKLNIEHEFICKDILELDESVKYDVGLTIGCLEVLIEPEETLKKIYSLIKSGGACVITSRVTNLPTINNPDKNYQKDIITGEKAANYPIFNISEFLRLLTDLSPRPKSIEMYGYWCTPASNTVCEYDRFCGAAFLFEKPLEQDCNEECIINIRAPYDLLV